MSLYLIIFLVFFYFWLQLYNSEVLIDYCHAYFLKNLAELVEKSEAFKKLVFQQKSTSFDVLNCLQEAIADKLYARFQKQTTVWRHTPYCILHTLYSILHASRWEQFEDIYHT